MPSNDLGQTLSLLWIIPFGGLLLAIALLPLVAPKFWEKNSRKAIVAACFGLPTAIYIGIQAPHEIWQTAQDYFSFVTLLATLFTISGGIHLKGDIQARPTTNALWLMIGAVLANLIGTTGASMLLIRPLLRINHERQHTGHLPVFFIFIVSNIGGALLPMGDPPLFLGYLQGVPFFWTLRIFPIWGFTVALLLAIFLVIDSIAYRRESPAALRLDKTEIEPVQIEGKLNLIWLAGVIFAAAVLPSPSREVTMWLMALLSWRTTSREIRQQNEFTFNPMIEVAVLFAGIFGAMIPALLILKARGGDLGIVEPWHFFWASGALSSFLDNAPTYLTFASIGQSVTKTLALSEDILLREGGISEVYLMAVSVGAVFMGANTYIGNAPNFMVKAISEELKCKVPSFLGYMMWSGLILIPVFILVTLVFFRG